MLHRYLTPQISVTTSPPVATTGRPQVSTYSGIRDQDVFAGGADLNFQYIYAATSSVYQWTISNTVNRRKASSLFFYELTPTGDLVSTNSTNIVTANYDYTQLASVRYTMVGANPVSMRTIAVCRQNGSDSQNSFGNWSTTYTTAGGQIMYHNGSSWASVGVPQAWVMQPVWNQAGTHVAASLTAGSGPGTNVVIGLVGWNGTALTGNSTITLPNTNYYRDSVWVGDTLVVISSGSGPLLSAPTVMTFLQRSGTTFTQVGQQTFVDEYITKLTPDSASRFFAGVSQKVGETNVVAPLLSIIYEGAGSMTVNRIMATPYPSNTGVTAFPVYPMKNGNVLLTRNVSNPNPSLFSTTPTAASQIPYNGSAFQGASGDVLVKAQPNTGTVVIVNSTSDNARIQKIS